MKIFVVDDDPAARMIAADQLNQPAYEVLELDSGEALLAAMQEAPDLVLLDIEMPGIDGIAACRALRQAGEEQVQVIFVSAHDDIETRLAAYDAGGSDFIVKPYNAGELAQKVRVAEGLLTRRTALADQAQFAQRTAFTAMSSMGEMGTVLQFLRTSFACETVERLAGLVFEALQQYDLQGLCEVRLSSGRRCFSSRGECTSLEDAILQHASGMDRIFQFRDRVAINYPDLTLLVPGLPMDDPDRVGRLRDHLAIRAEGADARIRAMESERMRAAQGNAIVGAVQELTETLAEVEKSQAQGRVRATEINSVFLRELTSAFVSLGLSEDQESTLADMAERTHAQLNALRDSELMIDDRLRAVTDQLRGLVGK